MERKIATKMSTRIAEFVNEKTGFNYAKQVGYFFHYPNLENFNGFKINNHLNNKIVEGYQEVTEQDFINYFNENETMKTKFIDVSGTSQQEKKETVFTHHLCTLKGWVLTEGSPSILSEVKYLGKCVIDGDMFAGYFDSGEITIYKGIKGDEFNS